MIIDPGRFTPDELHPSPPMPPPPPPPPLENYEAPISKGVIVGILSGILLAFAIAWFFGAALLVMKGLRHP